MSANGDAPAGARIGSYLLVREVGRGGMGVVFEARHHEIGRRAAIKVLRAEYAHDRVLAARLLNEARAVSRVSHIGIVSAFDFGSTPDGAPYLVMDFLDGVSLRQRLEQLRALGGFMSAASAIRLSVQVAAAVAAAHEAGIIHRDLKPENIFLVADSERPGSERAKVLDFGIAKLFPEAKRDGEPATADAPPALTDHHIAMGSPAYMAPEQWQGAADATAKTDVYALGVILYELFVGKRPFDGGAPAQIMKRHLFDPPPPLPPLPGVLPELGALVLRMLSKLESERPTMAAVAEALAAAGAGAAESTTSGRAPPASATVSQISLMPQTPAISIPTPLPTPGPALTPMSSPSPPVASRTWGRFAVGILIGMGIGALTATLSWQRHGGAISTTATVQPAVPAAPAIPVAASGPAPIIADSGARWHRLDSSTTDNLYSAWGSGPRDLWIVGADGLVLHYDGTAFNSVKLKAQSGRVDALRGVWGSGPADVWTVGRSGAVFRYDGQRWQELSSGTDEDLYAVFGVGPQKLWVAGQKGTLLAWSGRELLPLPAQVPTQQIIRSLWASADDNLWLAAASDANAGEVWHWDGQRWQSFAIGARLNKIWGTSPRDIWVAGGTLGNRGLLWHYSGRSFVPVEVGPVQWLHSIWSSRPNDVWVSAESNQLLHFDGATWSRAECDAPETFRALWGSDVNSIFAVGTRGAVCSFGGLEWRSENLPIAARQSLNAVWEAPSGDLWMVGRGGTVLRRHDDIFAPMASGTEVALSAVTGSAADDVWIVGEAGTVRHFDGTTFKSVALSGTPALYAAFAIARDDVWISGEAGTLLHWDGQALRAIATPRKVALRALFGTAADGIFVVGDEGTVLHVRDGRVRSVTTGVNAALHGVYQAAADTVYIVGEHGTLLRGNASGFSALPALTPEDLQVISGSASGGVWAAGGGGVLLRLERGSFRKVLSGTQMTLYGLHVNGRGQAWAVGQWGTALHR